MSLRERVAARCARPPGAEVSDPWGGGHAAWKAGGKMFACLGAVDPGVSVKMAEAETAAMLIEAGAAERAPDFHRFWARLPESAPEDERARRLPVSYARVRDKLPRRLRDASAPLEDA